MFIHCYNEAIRYTYVYNALIIFFLYFTSINISSNDKNYFKSDLAVFRALEAFISGQITQTITHLKRSHDWLGTCDTKINKFQEAYKLLLTKLTSQTPHPPTVQGPKACFHFGDSHCLSYAYHSLKLDGITHTIVPKLIIGAKAFHFSNQNNNRYKTLLEINFQSIPKNSKVLLSFGEIGFLHPLHMK